MSNPWQNLPIETYEAHMALPGVMQLQTLNAVMRAQFSDYPAQAVVILGIAGGNGLAHTGSTQNVYGIDINQDYLNTCRKRYAHLGQRLKLICADLSEMERLPPADIVIANLVIEYMGLVPFVRLVGASSSRYLSCVLQSGQQSGFVSASPYAHAFDRIAGLHEDIDEEALCIALYDIGFRLLRKEAFTLPNGNSLIRLDFLDLANENDVKGHI